MKDPGTGGTSEVMTVDQVAELLGVGRNAVYGYARAGKLPCRQIGKRLLFSRSAILEWLRGQPSKRSK